MKRLVPVLFVLFGMLGITVPSSSASAECYQWSGVESLESAAAAHSCIDIVPGTYAIPDSVDLWATHTINGNGATLIAQGPFWELSPLRANDSIFIVHTGAKLTASNLTLDGANVASYLVTPGGYTLSNMTFLNSGCSALGVMRSGAVVRDSLFVHHAWNCIWFSGLPLGAAIYAQHNNDQQYHFSPVITGNTFRDVYGPALDSNGVWGGTFSGNNVVGMTGWAAVSIFGGSYWKIENNTVSHRPSDLIQDFHPACVPNPAKSAAIFLCQDVTYLPWLTNFNVVSGNKAAGFYGILLIGDDERIPWVTPRLTTVTNNDVRGSHVGCFDDLLIGQWYDGNTWTGNNCAGTPNTGPLRK